MGTKKSNQILYYPDLSYKIVGVAFEVHNELGRYSREKQYCDALQKRLIELGLAFEREFAIGETGTRVDFVVESKILLEIKAKQVIIKDDYYQVRRYLQALGFKLGFILNFRAEYLRPRRMLNPNIDSIRSN